MSDNPYPYLNKHGIQTYIHLGSPFHMLQDAKKIADTISNTKGSSFVCASSQLQDRIMEKQVYPAYRFFISPRPQLKKPHSKGKKIC